jgi:hypothetical protein
VAAKVERALALRRKLPSPSRMERQARKMERQTRSYLIEIETSEEIGNA